MSIFDTLLAYALKKVSVACVFFISNSYAACVLNAVEIQQVRDVVDSNGGYSIPEQQCQLLQRKGLVLSVIGDGKVLGGASVAWAEVRLQDSNLGIMSNQAGISTFVNSSIATKKFSDDLLYQAIRDAVSRLNFEVAANEIDVYRSRSLELNSHRAGKPGL